MARLASCACPVVSPAPEQTWLVSPARIENKFVRERQAATLGLHRRPWSAAVAPLVALVVRATVKRRSGPAWTAWRRRTAAPAVTAVRAQGGRLNPADMGHARMMLTEKIRAAGGQMSVVFAAVTFVNLKKELPGLRGTVRDLLAQFPNDFRVEEMQGRDMVCLLKQASPTTDSLAQPADAARPKVVVAAKPTTADAHVNPHDEEMRPLPLSATVHPAELEKVGKQGKNKKTGLDAEPVLISNSTTTKVDRDDEVKKIVKEVILAHGGRVLTSELDPHYRKIRGQSKKERLTNFLSRFPDDFHMDIGFLQVHVEIVASELQEQQPRLARIQQEAAESHERVEDGFDLVAEAEAGDEEADGQDSHKEPLDGVRVPQRLPPSGPVVGALSLNASWCGSKVTLGSHALGPTPSKDDNRILRQAFDSCIAERGFLTSEFVRAEIEAACRARQVTEAQLFADKDVGPLVAGVAKMLLVVEATIRICFATQVIVTLHDIERAILEHVLFNGKNSLEEACLGKLQFHPEVARRLQLYEISGGIPSKFPEITAMQLVQKLFAVAEAGAQQKSGAGRMLSVASGLQELAKARGFDDYRKLCVYVQENSLLDKLLSKTKSSNDMVGRLFGKFQDPVAKAYAEWTALSNQEEHLQYLEHLGELCDPAKQQKFIESVYGAFGEDAVSDGPTETKGLRPYINRILEPLLAAARSRAKSPSRMRNEPDGMPAGSGHTPQEGTETSDTLVLSEAGSQLSEKVATGIAQHSDQLLQAAGPLHGSLLLQAEVAAFCMKLRSVCSDEAAILQAAQTHFGALVAPAELGTLILGPAAVDSNIAASVEVEPVVELQLGLATAGRLPRSRTVASEATDGFDPGELAQAAARAILSVPPLMDLAEAIPDWPWTYGPMLGDLPSFLRSSSFAREVGEPRAILEVRRGAFLRLPAGRACNSDAFCDAFKRKDARHAAAIALACLIDENAPVALLEDVAGQAYISWTAAGVGEAFVLAAVAALPRETPSAVLDLVASGYIRLKRPWQVLLEAARAAPELGLALRRLGLHFGILEWSTVSWDSITAVHQEGPGPSQAEVYGAMRGQTDGL